MSEVSETTETTETTEIETTETTLTPEQEEASNFGWKPYEQYVADGGDPSKYNGEKAFLEFNRRKREFIAKNKEYRELKSDMDKLTKGFSEMMKQQKESHKKELERQKEAAKSELDVEKMDQLDKEIRQVEKEIAEVPEPQSEPQQYQEPAIIQNFRANNPFLDHGSPNFEPEFNALVERRVNFAINDFAMRNQQAPDDRTLNKIMKQEYDRAKPEFPGLFRTEKRKAPAASKPSNNSQPAKSKSAASQLDGMSKDLYDTIFKRQGEKAAEQFAQSVIGG